MKKTLLSMFLFAFVIFGFTGHSWAFGSRHHHHDGQSGDQGDQGDQGDSSLTDYTINGSNSWSDPGSNSWESDPSWNKDWEHKHGTDGNDPSWNQDDPNNSPGDPVPEPMTLSLMGMGLALVLLKRKIKSRI